MRHLFSTLINRNLCLEFKYKKVHFDFAWKIVKYFKIYYFWKHMDFFVFIL